jgi:hypothetical protein
MYEPWRILFYTLAAVIAAVAVSLLTPPVAAGKLDRFYALMRTPVGPNEPAGESCTLPAGVAPAPRRMLVTAFGLELPVPSAVSVLGFIATWGMVGAIVAGFMLLVRM